MAVLRPCPVSIAHFHYDAGKFWQEVSYLEHTCQFRPGRVYDDACDEGFTMISPRGNQTVFALDRTDRSDDEVQGWHFVQVWPRTEHPARVLVIND